MTLFQELRSLIADEPDGREASAADDKRIKQLCIQEGALAWKRLLVETGFDLRAVF
jgi:hypothetical protein